ncbi:hypothetical protein E2C01_046037 [Portunus trituberculatus]|uniref:Uncharacterized protein n=1 Tax=Portunus trituberculatus TaxID=210409 RepID=A0A5B7G402_PORTR|nr:hypothetical protein [Portunus trituberculatus]
MYEYSVCLPSSISADTRPCISLMVLTGIPSSLRQPVTVPSTDGPKSCSSARSSPGIILKEVDCFE